eukprot:scaffold328764_cov17-Prasinocladus_malaysianus.AAC.1
MSVGAGGGWRPTSSRHEYGDTSTSILIMLVMSPSYEKYCQYREPNFQTFTCTVPGKLAYRM